MAPSLSTILQYIIAAGIGYVLVGSPVLRSLTGEEAEEPLPEISAEKIDSLVIPDPDLQCPEHKYTTHIFSRDPLVLYIPDFLSDEEIDHIVEISTPHFTPSTVWTGGQEHHSPSIRASDKAAVPRTPRVRCVEARARALQGWRPSVFVEKLWAQRYRPGGHYAHHYDWASAGRRRGRVSSFMVYLGANCTGGGTNFPRLGGGAGWAGEWCEYVECGEGKGEGVTFKPVRGAAVYWENFRPDGTGYEESWHAGLPVESGEKIGLNIWSWLHEGFDPLKKKEEENRFLNDGNTVG